MAKSNCRLRSSSNNTGFVLQHRKNRSPIAICRRFIEDIAVRQCIAVLEIGMDRVAIIYSGLAELAFQRAHHWRRRIRIVFRKTAIYAGVGASCDLMWRIRRMQHQIGTVQTRDAMKPLGNVPPAKSAWRPPMQYPTAARSLFAAPANAAIKSNRAAVSSITIASDSLRIGARTCSCCSGVRLRSDAIRPRASRNSFRITPKR
jgi:hypothetical protein